ncbi:MAG: transglutaminase family protein [Acidimicrobiales bacterium]
MTHYQVVHRTRYRYDAPVSSSYGQSCLLPRDFATQRCVGSQLVITPEPEDQRERIDFYGNRVSYFKVDRGHTELEIVATSTVNVLPERGVLPLEAEMLLRDVPVALDGDVDAVHYLLDSQRAVVDDRVRAFAAECFDPDASILAGVSNLVRKIHSSFEFDAEATTVTSTLDDLFEHRAGVCQDFAHLAVAALRSQGLPARYVSGYLETIPPPGKPKLVGADVSHAWASVMVPGAGWIDLDPTNDQFVDERYVTTGWGRDYGDVPPLKGVIYSESSKTRLSVSVDVTRQD